jgi:hypothetical protein
MATPSTFARALVGDTSGYERGTAIWAGANLEAAVKSRSGLFFALGAAAGAILGGAPALLLAVPALYVVLFAGAFLNGRGRQAALRRARGLPIRLPPESSFFDSRAQALAARLARARVALREVVSSAPNGPGFELGPALARVPDLERDAVVVLSRFDYVARFIHTHPVDELRAELERLRKHAPYDDASREILSGAIRRCRTRLEAAAALGGVAERLVATAGELVGTLEQLPTDVVRLQLQRFESCAPVVTAARERAERLIDDVAALGRALLGRNEAVDRGEADQFAGRVHLELPVDPSAVRLHRLDADEEPRGELDVGVTVEDEVEHLALSHRQPRQPAASAEVVADLGSERPGHVTAAEPRLLDGGHQLLERRRLEDVTVRACGQRVDHDGRLAERRVREDAALRRGAAELADGDHAVRPRHHEVQQDEVGGRPLDHRDRLARRPGLADDVERGVPRGQ